MRQQHVPNPFSSVRLVGTSAGGMVVVVASVVVVVVVVVVVGVVVGVVVVEVLMVVGAMVVGGRGTIGVGVGVRAEATEASVNSTTREEVGESRWLKTRQQEHR